MNRPKVSIVTVSYNQEKYISQALDSFLMQKKDFGIEIVVSDDHSTDKTAKIIKDYTQRYPDEFNPILRQKNVGAVSNFVSAMQAARGEYIALCEGDDYWTNPLKLQKQVDFLDKHSDYALCFHPVKVFFENDASKDSIYPDPREKNSFTNRELLKRNFIQTNSVMYRRQNYQNIPTNIMPLDWYLHLYHANFGKVGFINEVMGAYRRHEGGTWLGDDKDVWERHGESHLNFYIEVIKLYGDSAKTRLAMDEPLQKMFKVLSRLAPNHKDLFIRAVKQFPESSAMYMSDQQNQLEQKNKETQILGEELEKRVQIYDELSKELKRIHNSKSWAVAKKIARIRAVLMTKKP